MDELFFRMDRAVERIQVQLTMAAENGLGLIRQYSDEGRNQLITMSNDPSFNVLKSSAREAWQNYMRLMDRFKLALLHAIDMNFIYEQLMILYRDEISRNNIWFVSVGFGLGTTGGILLGLWMARPHLQTPIMRAISTLSYDEADLDLHKTYVPQLKYSNDVLIRVRAVCINRIDYRISRGYGRTIRCILNNYNKSNNPEFPLVLGRGCAGIVEAVGKHIKSGLEIGDEVWVVSPWYESGLGSELIVANEKRVERKPFTIGFECAASLPYSGCYALLALKRAKLNEQNCYGKRFLIEEGCSPVGCVLTQLLKQWGGYVIATSSERAGPVIKALGADEVIILKAKEDYADEEIYESPTKNVNSSSPSIEILIAELDKRFNNNIDRHIDQQENLEINSVAVKSSKYDVIFLTTKSSHNFKELTKYLNNNKTGDPTDTDYKEFIISTVENNLPSDNYGFVKKRLLSFCIKLKEIYLGLFNIEYSNENEPHFCCNELDRLSGYVNDGILKTVIDLVYTPQDVKSALQHICSSKSIGNTIVTFRS